MPTPRSKRGSRPPARQNRWKTGFRAILAIPASLIAGGFSSLLLLVGILCWFTALVRAEIPRGLRTVGALALRYHAATAGYLLMLTDAYPYTGPLQGDAPHLVDPPVGWSPAPAVPADVPPPTGTPPGEPPAAPAGG